MPQPKQNLALDDVLHQKISEFARAFGRYAMREKGYTTLLCSRLESALPYRVFTPSGAMLTTVHQHLTPEELQVAARLRNANDFYPDVLITGRPLTDLMEANLRQLQAMAPLGMDALLELKFHSSFGSMTRRHVIDDAVKLDMVGSYIERLTGKRPQLHFYFFNFPHPEQGIKRHELARRWLERARAEAPRVNAHLLTADGEIEAVA